MAFKREHDNVLCLRKTSCDSQWELIKSKFINFNKINTAGVVASVKSLVQNEVGITRRIQTSDKALSELLLDGSELISNVRVANDKREIDRRRSEKKIRENLLTDLRNESVEAEKKFVDLKKRWQELIGYKEPMGLYEGLEFQKNKIEDLMAQKNGVIQQLHDALDNSNQRYYEDQEKQDADIDCLIERIDSQVEVMKRAYREHLELLQKTIDDERDAFKNSETEKWQNLYDTREEYEQKHMSRKKEQSAEYNLEIKKIALEHEELIRSTKIRLERDNDELQIQLQNVKAEIMLNSEKLSYNHHVLQKRSDENVIIKGQQKKRLNKLNSLIAGLKAKIKTVKDNGEHDISKLTVDVMRLYTNILEMEAKAAIFAEVNDEKYHTVWEMNDKEVKALLRDILAIDKVIFDQQLGIEWYEPDNPLLAKKDLVSYNEALKLVEKVRVKSSNPARQQWKIPSSESDSQKKLDVLKLVSQKIASNVTWLIDHNLPPLMDHSSEERNFIKLDNVFASLGIYDITNAALLESFFLPYIWCPNCSSPCSPCSSEQTKFDCDDHYLVIDSANIVPAIREYIKKCYHQYVNESSSALSYSGTTICRLMKASDVFTFWKAYTDMFSEIKEKTWIALEIGLGQYLQILKKRDKLDMECSFLRNQNEELKHLLKMYLPET
ncbi:dynein regulatory complex protein 1 homolog [Bradysia coprophila]|uniref:dynein regulatory complex protein 1 homolog n=1 Tax=Bradysia coprophila TaxID=38358 RepID=UPI00187DA46D|nr:dynein regulatory complex protein 1 homolog [Bradysia coprophila]